MAKLVHQDDDWWNRDPHEINREITAWVDAARLQPSGLGPQPLDLENIPAPEPQNPTAVRFTTEFDEPIDVDLNADRDTLFTDGAAQDRHGEVRRLAEHLIALYEPGEPGANTVTGLIEDARLYLDALGDSQQEPKADLTVIRGDGLRQTQTAQENRDDDFSDLPQLSDKYVLALRKLLSAHNAYVSFDPILAAKDEGLAGQMRSRLWYRLRKPGKSSRLSSPLAR
jgi:hypothetical protein